MPVFSSVIFRIKKLPGLLAEEIFYLVHPGIRSRIVVPAILIVDTLKLTQQFPLTVSQVYRCFDYDVAMQIAMR